MTEHIQNQASTYSRLCGFGSFTKTGEMLMDPYSRTGMSYHSFFLCSPNFVERLRRAGHSQFLQVVHEDLQADVIRKDRGSCLLSPGVEVVVGL